MLLRGYVCKSCIKVLAWSRQDEIVSLSSLNLFLWNKPFQLKFFLWDRMEYAMSSTSKFYWNSGSFSVLLQYQISSFDPMSRREASMAELFKGKGAQKGWFSLILPSMHVISSTKLIWFEQNSLARWLSECIYIYHNPELEIHSGVHKMVPQGGKKVLLHHS